MAMVLTTKTQFLDQFTVSRKVSPPKVSQEVTTVTNLLHQATL